MGGCPQAEAGQGARHPHTPGRGPTTPPSPLSHPTAAPAVPETMQSYSPPASGPLSRGSPQPSPGARDARTTAACCRCSPETWPRSRPPHSLLPSCHGEHPQSSPRPGRGLQERLLSLHPAPARCRPTQDTARTAGSVLPPPRDGSRDHRLLTFVPAAWGASPAGMCPPSPCSSGWDRNAAAGVSAILAWVLASLPGQSTAEGSGRWGAKFWHLPGHPAWGAELPTPPGNPLLG